MSTSTPLFDLPTAVPAWIDLTHYNDPAQPFFVARLREKLRTEGYPRVLCFWTKAPAIVAQLYADLIREMQDQGTTVLAQVTLNNEPQLEPGVTPERARLDDLITLLGAPAIRLRYDPIIPGRATLLHIQKTVCTAQAYGITHVTVNFFSPYPAAVQRLHQQGIQPETWSAEQKAGFLDALLIVVARPRGITLAGCAEIARLNVPGSAPARCADPIWAHQVNPALTLAVFKWHPSRQGCGCFYTQDWGLYANRGGPACPHGCLYCYAR